MPNTFLISDTHFCHENIIEYCNRPFKNTTDMNWRLVDNWNSVVGDSDNVYVLGDFVCGRPENVYDVLSLLNGHIHLIRGNHDTNSKVAIYESVGIPVKDIEYFRYKGLFFIFNHFPITDEGFYKMVSDGNSEVVDVHGHVHDASPFADLEHNKFNVSADAINFTPVNIDVLYNAVRGKYTDKGVWKGN